MSIHGQHGDHACGEGLASGRFNHMPIRAPRHNHEGEEIFAQEWSALMEKPLSDDEKRWNKHWYEVPPPGVRLTMILTDMGTRVRQRHATVAASFIMWLGTNCGAGLIHSARRLQRAFEKSGEPGFNAWISAWAIEGRRCRGINSGVRTIEAVLAPTWDATREGAMRDAVRTNVSYEDAEVIEHVMEWLGDEEQGRDFLRQCEAKIEARREERRRREASEWKEREAGRNATTSAGLLLL